MKPYIKYSLIAVAFVAVIAIAVFGYDSLSSRYQPEEPEKEGRITATTADIEKAPDATALTTEGSAQAPDATAPATDGSAQAPDTTAPTTEGSEQAPDTTAPTTEGSEQTPDTTAPTTDSSKADIEQAPDFTVTDMDGNKVNLSDFFGKPIVVNFWATWCGPCKSELPAFDKQYAANKDAVVFLMVNLTDGYRDTESGVKSFVADNQYSFPVYFDTDYSAAIAYGVSSIPMTIFIDKDGAVFDYQIGAMQEATLGSYIAALTD